MDFRKDKAVILATIYWQTGKAPSTFSWLAAARKDNVTGDKRLLGYSNKKVKRNYNRKERRGRKPALSEGKMPLQEVDSFTSKERKVTSILLYNEHLNLTIFQTTSPGNVRSSHLKTSPLPNPEPHTTFIHKIPSPISEPRTSPPSCSPSTPSSPSHSPKVRPVYKHIITCVSCSTSGKSNPMRPLCDSCREMLVTSCLTSANNSEDEFSAVCQDMEYAKQSTAQFLSSEATHLKRKKRVLKRTRLWSLPFDLDKPSQVIDNGTFTSIYRNTYLIFVNLVIEVSFLNSILPPSKKQRWLERLKSPENFH
jgi:hypothetical protein